MTYTVAALIGVVAAVLIDLVVLRTRLITRRIWWVSYALVVCGQLAMNGFLTGFRIVVYAPAAILGDGVPRFFGTWRVVFAPVEDLLFGFAMVLLTVSVWVWLGCRGIGREPSGGPPLWRR